MNKRIKEGYAVFPVHLDSRIIDATSLEYSLARIMKDSRIVTRVSRVRSSYWKFLQFLGFDMTKRMQGLVDKASKKSGIVKFPKGSWKIKKGLKF